MIVPTFLGEFPQTVLALIFSFGCALALAFICLDAVLRLVTREKYNVTDAAHNVNDDPRRIRAVVWHGDGTIANGANHGTSGASNDATIGGASHARRGGAARRPYLLPAAAPRNRFARISESDGAPSGGILELPVRAGTGVEKSGDRNSWNGAA